MPPFMYETKKGIPIACLSATGIPIIPNRSLNCYALMTDWGLIHHLPAVDDDYLSLAGGAEEAAGEVVHPFAICTH